MKAITTSASIHRAALVAALLVSVPLGGAAAQQAANAMTACYRTAALDGATRGCDAPDAVVEATYRACAEQEATWHQALRRAGGAYGGGMAESIFTRFKANSRGILLTLIARTRAEKGLCR